MDEKKIEEVMALVYEAMHHSADAREHYAMHQEAASAESDNLADECAEAIETKLRQLLGEQHG